MKKTVAFRVDEAMIDEICEYDPTGEKKISRAVNYLVVFALEKHWALREKREKTKVELRKKKSSEN